MTSLPLALGEISDRTDLAADLGKSWMVAGSTYTLFKASGALTLGKGLFYKPDGTTDYNVAAVAGAAALIGAVAGVCPVAYDGVVLAAGDYFLLQTGGYATVATAGDVAAGKGLATLSTAGKVDDTTVTYETAVCHAVNAGTGATYVLAKLNLGF